MTAINMAMFALGNYNVNDNFQKGYDRAYSIAIHDWDNALNEFDYGSGPKWQKHNDFDKSDGAN